ncbi:hypothetical protein [Methylobacterium sp. WL6]|uniref:hypothetical protein n=1 Tax=Methylobacterium sp. WL6 TaxID=2603901 RepID=UPI0011C95542|nr:hypothetical protein [Methylobacterium sp. WL6]TXN73261.1 hypothetical protein FV230_01965 [Methylobacterium sp. WL6]
MVEKPVGRRGRPRGGEEARSNLEYHGGSYRVTILVPERVRHLVGAARLRHDLKTGNLQVAALAKIPHVDKFRERIDEALASLGETQRDRDVAAYLAVVEDWRLRPDRYPAGAIAELERQLGIPYEDRVGEREQSDRFEPGQTSLAGLHDRYIREQAGRLSPRTLVDDRTAILWLLRLLAQQSTPAAMEAVTDRTARDIAEGMRDRTGMAPTTAAKLLSRLSAFWKWAIAQGLTTDNPWPICVRGLRYDASRNKVDSQTRQLFPVGQSR